MEEDENLTSNKRARYGETVADLHRIIEEKNNAYLELSFKFDKLQKDFERLLNSFDPKFSTEENITSEEDMAVDETVSRKLREGKKNKKNKTSSEKKSKNRNQAKAVAGLDAKTTRKGADMDVNTLHEGDHLNAALSGDDVPGSCEARPKIADNSISKSKNVPTITAYNVNFKEISQIIDRALGHCNYNVKLMGRNATNIGVCTLVDFEKLKKVLIEQKVNYFTYTPKQQRPFSLVVEGLSGTYTEDDVRDYLGSLQIRLDIIRIVKFDNDRWLLQFSRESDITAFFNVRYVLRCRVNIRKFRRGTITQCFNCQRFGHTSANCNMPYRCVKCGASHGPGNCSIPPKGDDDRETLVTDPVTGQVTRRIGHQVRCVNCGVNGHVASSKECPRRIELLRKIEAKRAPSGRREMSRHPVSSNLRTGLSYAATAATATAGGLPSGFATPNSSSGGTSGSGIDLKSAMAQFDFVDRDCKRFFGGGLLDCLTRIGGFAREYSVLDNDEDKSRALLGILLSLRHNG